MVYKSANKEEQGDEFTGRPAGYGEKSAWPVNIEACENDGDYSQGWRITEESGNRTFTIYHQWGDPVRVYVFLEFHLYINLKKILSLFSPICIHIYWKLLFIYLKNKLYCIIIILVFVCTNKS